MSSIAVALAHSMAMAALVGSVLVSTVDNVTGSGGSMHSHRLYSNHQDIGPQYVVVAIGECGLITTASLLPTDVQKKYFEKQFELAYLMKLPMFLHMDDLQIPSSPYFPTYDYAYAKDMDKDRFQWCKSCFQILNTALPWCFNWTPKRIIRCGGGAVDDDMPNIKVAQLLYLETSWANIQLAVADVVANFKVPVSVNIEAYDPSYITEQVKLKAQELRCASDILFMMKSFAASL
ncbi:hypothetical protein LOK49_Contig172G00002 [Camellia lanceoleosa]|nr:hypothetical protein LOK49_Contig172G00002 [Camellia lanceoleosa]